MSYPLIHPAGREAELAECARLIPGEVPEIRPTRRRPPRSIGPALAMEREQMPKSTLSASLFDTLAPHPLRVRKAQASVGSIGMDCALIALNWICLGAALLPLGVLVPETRLFEFGTRSLAFLLGIALLNAALITLVAYTEGLYAVGYQSSAEVRSVGRAVMWGGLVMFFAYGMQGSHWIIGGLISLASLLHFASMWGWRWWSSGRDVRRNDHPRNVLIVGAGRVGRRVAAYIERHSDCDRRICGFLDDDRPLGNEVVGRISELALMARKGFVDEVILAAPHDEELAGRMIREAKRLRLDLEIVPELFGCDPAEQEVEYLGGLPVICVHAERLPAAGLVLKRMIDIAGSSLGLILASPLLMTIAALIKLDSRGPVLYVAKRAGKKGRSFHCYKFRTMVSDAERRKDLLREKNQRSGPIFKIFDDPRITRVGHLLRRYSLDELPQLWNVLSGEMSLVGPRPHPVEEFAAYELNHLARLDVTPGLTGLWQVSARRDPSFERAMELDREYIRTWNLRSDFRILLKTVLAVARGSGN